MEVIQLEKKILWFHEKLYVKVKNQGGLGVLDLTIMNKSLLVKWMVRYRDLFIQGL
jgi:hypothetical protein